MILIRQNEKYLEPTQNINNTTTESQSQSQIPSTKRHISDIINYYSKWLQLKNYNISLF